MPYGTTLLYMRIKTFQQFVNISGPTVKYEMVEFHTKFWIVLFSSLKLFYVIANALNLRMVASISANVLLDCQFPLELLGCRPTSQPMYVVLNVTTYYMYLNTVYAELAT